MAARVKEDDEGVIVTELKVKGKELGAIFIIEELKDGKIKEDEMETISALSLHVAIAINNAKMYGELLEKERIQKEIAIAAEIQKNLLPKDIKAAFGLEIANYFEPAREVGGDYYDYFISAEGKLSVAIGDVSASE
jgi:sigma-B regulation protein RsbU (phosphoserine phosphatase)